jgi:Uma2 family endonuclease
MTEGLEVLTNPQMIVEVLLPSTEAFDRDEKFSYYKSIESFTEYLLVAVNRPFVTQFIKQNENEWIQREALDKQGKLFSPLFNAEFLLSEIYLNEEFPERLKNLFLVDR